jgi:hypothetical protein
MSDLWGILAKCVLIIAGAAVTFAFITFSPMIFCHGGGAGGNCGEGLLASLPLALLLTPVILVFGTIYFFRSTKKVLLSVLVLVAVAIAIPTAVGHIGAFAVRSYRSSHPTEEMKNYTLRSYTDCLQIRAKNRAYDSNDPSAIEDWSREKCAKGRKAFFDDFPGDAERIAVAEHEFRINLPLIIASTKHSR